MPKKYKQKSLLTKPTSSAPPNLSSSRPSVLQDVPITRSVNDLIRDSRRDAGHEGPPTLPSASSIHPALRAVLDLPAPLPPVPRHGIRGPSRLRRIPGPPPPQSWLSDSAHAPFKVRNVPWSKAHERSRVQRQTSMLPEGSFPQPGSLQDSIMRSMASNWMWHVEYDHEYLAELPIKIKENLLSYVAIYNEGQGPNPLRLLFPRDLEQDELDEVRRLDLGNAVGGWSTLKRLDRELEKEQIHKNVSPKSDSRHEEAVPDSWDNDEVFHRSSIPVPVMPGGLRFRNLKHLSLAIAPDTKPSTASWNGLLGLVSKLSILTSISLAYWPRPTLTPNASTGVIKVANTTAGSLPSTHYGGTNFYSAFDNDWREASGILRTLSRSLYCLKWLDLTGCGDWFAALTWQDPDEDEKTTVTGPDWNGSWRQLVHLNLSVGWMPGPAPLLQSSVALQSLYTTEEQGHDNPNVSIYQTPNSLSRISRMRLQPADDTQPEAWNVEHERDKYYHRLEVARYDEIIGRAKKITKDIRASRKVCGGKWIDAKTSTEE